MRQLGRDVGVFGCFMKVRGGYDFPGRPRHPTKRLEADHLACIEPNDWLVVRVYPLFSQRKTDFADSAKSPGKRCAKSAAILDELPSSALRGVI